MKTAQELPRHSSENTYRMGFLLTMMPTCKKKNNQQWHARGGNYKTKFDPGEQNGKARSRPYGVKKCD